MYIEAHCHLADPRFEGLLPEVLSRARSAGIARFLQGGVDPADWDRQEALARAHPGVILPVFGLHPWWVAKASNEAIERGLEALEGRLPGALALGELGLDFGPRWPASSHSKQLRAFQAQLGLAARMNKPLVLHVVKAHAEALGVLHASQSRFTGLVHSFSGSFEIARQYISQGFLISVSGVVTRKGYESLKKSVVRIPPESLVLETDSPDQPPSGRTGLNEPAALLDVARAVSGLRGEEPAALLARSAENLRSVFKYE